MPIPAHALLMAAGGSATPFSPEDIAGLLAWWDAADQSAGSMQIGAGGEVGKQRQRTVFRRGFRLTSSLGGIG